METKSEQQPKMLLKKSPSDLGYSSQDSAGQSDDDHQESGPRRGSCDGYETSTHDEDSSDRENEELAGQSDDDHQESGPRRGSCDGYETSTHDEDLSDRENEELAGQSDDDHQEPEHRRGSWDGYETPTHDEDSSDSEDEDYCRRKSLLQDESSEPSPDSEDNNSDSDNGSEADDIVDSLVGQTKELTLVERGPVRNIEETRSQSRESTDPYPRSRPSTSNDHMSGGGVISGSDFFNYVSSDEASQSPQYVYSSSVSPASAGDQNTESPQSLNVSQYSPLNVLTPSPYEVSQQSTYTQGQISSERWNFVLDEDPHRLDDRYEFLLSVGSTSQAEWNTLPQPNVQTLEASPYNCSQPGTSTQHLLPLPQSHLTPQPVLQVREASPVLSGSSLDSDLSREIDNVLKDGSMPNIEDEALEFFLGVDQNISSNTVVNDLYNISTQVSAQVQIPRPNIVVHGVQNGDQNSDASTASGDNRHSFSSTSTTSYSSQSYITPSYSSQSYTTSSYSSPSENSYDSTPGSSPSQVQPHTNGYQSNIVEEPVIPTTVHDAEDSYVGENYREQMKAKIHSNPILNNRKIQLCIDANKLNEDQLEERLYQVAQDCNTIEIEECEILIITMIESLKNRSIPPERLRTICGKVMRLLALRNKPMLVGYVAQVALDAGLHPVQNDNNCPSLIHKILQQRGDLSAVLSVLLSLKDKNGLPVFNVNDLNEDGFTNLQLAVQMQRTDYAIRHIKVLLEHNASLLAQRQSDGRTVLHDAIAVCSDDSIAKVLLEEADRRGQARDLVTIADYRENTALSLAVDKLRYGLVHALHQRAAIE